MARYRIAIIQSVEAAIVNTSLTLPHRDRAPDEQEISFSQDATHSRAAMRSFSRDFE